MFQGWEKPEAGGGSSRTALTEPPSQRSLRAGSGDVEAAARARARGSVDASVGGDSSTQESAQTRTELLRNFLFDLNSSIAPTKVRKEAIRFAVEFFGHGDVLQHDEEVDLGAVNVLFSKLAFSHTILPRDEEVSHAATCLQIVVTGCRREKVSQSWDECGTTVLPLMVDVIRKPDQTHPDAVNCIIKVLRAYSRCPKAMVPIANAPGALNALLLQAKLLPEEVVSATVGEVPEGAGGETGGESKSGDDEDDVDDDDDDGPSPDTARRIDALATIVNLACAEENKFQMANHPHLLSDILHVANNDPSHLAREHATATIMNLSYHDNNKEHMAQNEDILDTLVMLMGDSSPNARRYASAALFTLACVISNTATMASHRDGRIVESLRVVLLEDTYDLARANAAEALANMARNNTDDTVERMAAHPQLIDSLAEAVANDDNPDVRNFAAEALECIARDVHHPSESYDILLDALVKSSCWTGTVSVANALRCQASHVENRKVMAEHPGMLDALANMALLTESEDAHVRECAVSAIERLSTEVSTRPLLSHHEGIMTALTRASFSTSSADEEGGGEDLGDGQGADSNSMRGIPTSVLMKEALKNLTQTM